MVTETAEDKGKYFKNIRENSQIEIVGIKIDIEETDSDNQKNLKKIEIASLYVPPQTQKEHMKICYLSYGKKLL